MHAPHLFRKLSCLLALVALCPLAYCESTLAEGLPLPVSHDPILCVGDSLTYGEGGNGITYPGVLSALSGNPTVNMGLSGWIPRHIVYYVLLHEVPVLTQAQLKGIPPSEYENRRNQPGINALRTFIRPGQTVWVADPNNPASPPRQFFWDANPPVGEFDSIRPTAVGDLNHRPFANSGGWRKVAAPTSHPATVHEYSGVVFCVGANGMEADDIHTSLATLLQLLKPRDGHFLVLGLINRADPIRDPGADVKWAPLIAGCNETIRADYPDHFIDLQAWFTSSGTYQGRGYQTTTWVKSATPEELDLDAKSQGSGILPRSVRTPGNTTHLNAIGYTIIGTLTYEWVVLHGWLGTGMKPAK
jgi:hypothetical protein